MALFKCKMCGGALEINNNETVATCEYCGTQQTLPKLDDDRRANLYDRANHFRRNNEFDKAMGIYEQILNEDNTDAEAYWSLVLCRYGIEYVEDPASHKRVPTVNRAQFTSVFDDDNYKSALQYADGYQRSIYEEEAKAINEIQKGIIAISQKEEPFDVFICYKETDNSGRRTPDSVLANDLYHQLTQEGFKVFFARITLEDKLGSAYEPYIFAALNSAKVMVVLGTKPEFFKAVWVRNEWSRYLALIKQGQKKMLVPAYKDMDPYDLPEEFSHLQAQDMSKLGFMQDLIRGIKKIAEADTPKTTVVKETVISGGNANTAPLLKRAFMFLEDGNWNSANEYCEKVLDIDPENASAYLGKLLSELRVRKQESLKDQAEPFGNSNNYQKAICFADEKLKAELIGYMEQVRLNSTYAHAKNIMLVAQGEGDYKEAAQLFEAISEYLDSAVLAKECYDKAGEAVENKKKCNELFKAYKASVRNEVDGEARKVQAEKNIKGLTLRRQELLELRKNWKKIESNVASYNNEIENIQETIERLHNESEKLGLFSGKRKKEIAAEIASGEEKIPSIRKMLIDEKAKKRGFASMESLNNDIVQTETKIAAQKEIIAEIAAMANPQEILNKLGNYEYGRQLVLLLRCAVGDRIKFGTYPQTDAGDKKDIEWLVLEVRDGKAFAVSEYALDCKPYNTGDVDVTWETCTLRKWLNNDFINAAFSDDEKAMIATVTVSADKNPRCSTSAGKATQDQVFLLSLAEMNNYFGIDDAMQCKATDFADANGAYVNSTNGNCGWWLRSPGMNQNAAVVVNIDGTINDLGYSVDWAFHAVRPALWIDLNS